MMANDRQIVNSCLVAALDDLFDRRLAPRNRYRSKQHIFSPRILQAQREIAFAGLHAERQRATLSRCENIAQQRESRRLAVQIKRLLKK